jgi:Lrp/AsnC family leucine-responsive transcriptional regulator
MASPRKMRGKDMHILSFLRQNGRMPLTDISKKTGVPVSTLFDMVRTNLRGSVGKYTCLLDFTSLGYNSRATIMLRVAQEDKQAMAEYVAKHPAVNSAVKMANGYDFLLEAVFKTVAEAEAFLDTLSKRFKIAEKQAFFVVADLKREGFMSDPQFLV